jgi:hypothetical protein
MSGKSLGYGIIVRRLTDVSGGVRRVEEKHESDCGVFAHKPCSCVTERNADRNEDDGA